METGALCGESPDYDLEGRFYYQQTRFYTKKFTFLRWCNAWMCRALASHLLHSRHEEH
jgi:hypothetical protein